MFATHHGGANWMSAIITDATKASGSSYSTAGAKAEAIQKTIMDSIAMQSIITDLEHAGHAEHGETPAQKNAYWDSAAAKYFGTTAARSSTIYARADKRGKNFGQMEAGSISGEGEVSKVNKNILAAFNSGPSEANMNTIIKNLKVIYTQATLRYAYLVNEDLAEATDWNEHQAEGFAFYNNIAPYVKAKTPTATTCSRTTSTPRWFPTLTTSSATASPRLCSRLPTLPSGPRWAPSRMTARSPAPTLSPPRVRSPPTRVPTIPTTRLARLFPSPAPSRLSRPSSTRTSTTPP